MKATDLMVLDWVKFGADKLRIAEIYDAGVYTMDVMATSNRGYPLEDLEPIPLTSEILEQNGFVLVAVGDNGVATPKKNRNRYEKWECRTMWQRFNLFYDRTCKWYTLNAFDNTIRNIRFVHELQHALRMCGAEKEIEL